MSGIVGGVFHRPEHDGAAHLPGRDLCLPVAQVGGHAAPDVAAGTSVVRLSPIMM